jgi:hypothetical protein
MFGRKSKQCSLVILIVPVRQLLVATLMTPKRLARCYNWRARMILWPTAGSHYTHTHTAAGRNSVNGTVHTNVYTDIHGDTTMYDVRALS